MEFPVRCFSCGSVIGHLYEDYLSSVKEKERGIVLDELGVHRPCCRRMFLSHVDIVGKLVKYRR